MISFILLSDTHATVRDNISSIRPDKISNINTIINYQDTIDAIIIAGDLLDTGSNGEYCCECNKNKQGIFCCMTTQYYDELSIFKKFIANFRHDKLYLCLGNHDTYSTSIKTILYKFITGGLYPETSIQGFLHRFHKNVELQSIKNNGDLMYNFRKQFGINHSISSGINHSISSVNFICLGIYPDNTSILFFKKVAKDYNEPIVLFFHYPVSGPYSDWWSDEEKNIFYENIKLFNIICICVGHYHDTYYTTWNDIPVVSGAGESIMHVIYNGNNIEYKII